MSSIKIMTPTQPLTDDEIDDLTIDGGIRDCLEDPYDCDNNGDNYGSVKYDIRRVWRLAEATHGITITNKSERVCYYECSVGRVCNKCGSKHGTLVASKIIKGKNE